MFAFAAALGLAARSHQARQPVLAAIGVRTARRFRAAHHRLDERRIALARSRGTRPRTSSGPKFNWPARCPPPRRWNCSIAARLAAPHDPAIAAEIGNILLSEGQPDAALEEFGRALALDPTNAQYVNNRGVALQALGQTEAARADFVRALRFDPNLTEARENLAKLPPQ